MDDDVIVFPLEAEGRHAVAQGTVEVKDMTREEYVDWLGHMAEVRGLEFDEASVGEGPYRFIQILGTGAEIGDD